MKNFLPVKLRGIETAVLRNVSSVEIKVRDKSSSKRVNKQMMGAIEPTKRCSKSMKVKVACFGGHATAPFSSTTYY